MMQTYADYLKSLGASEDDVKVLDTPVARKAYDKMQADAAAAVAAANEKSVADMNAYRETMTQWYEEKVLPESQAANAEAVAAKAEAARAKAAILAAAQRDEGLKQVAKNMGWDVDGGTPAPQPNPATPPGFDPAQYFKKDEIVSALTREADVIMLAQDIAAEHATLFPGQRLNFRELGNEARAKKKDLQAYWEEKYKVSDARAAQTAAREKERDDKIRKEERERVETEMASRYGNPMTRPPLPSTSPFAKIVPSADTKQPWDRPDASGDRVKRATEAVIKQQQAGLKN